MRNLRRITRPSDERGIALAIAVFALVVIGALVAGTMFAGRLEQRTGTNTVFVAQAAEAADAGVAGTLTAWQPSIFNVLPMGNSVVLTTVNLGGGTFYTPTVTRLSEQLFFIETVGSRVGLGGATLAEHKVGGVTRLEIPWLDARAALTVKGLLTLGGSANLDGFDDDPDNWGAYACLANPNRPGIRYNHLLAVFLPPLLGGPVITGENPSAKWADGTLADSVFDKPFNELKVFANITLGPSITGIAPALTAGTPQFCNTSLATNWGEPNATPAANVAQCQTYFPIMYRNGDLSVGGGRGQGILLVEGNLDITGNFDFAGVIIVRGNLTVRGSATGSQVHGAVLVKNSLDLSILGGGSPKPEITYSSCAIKRALEGSARPVMLAERGWVQLY